VKVKKRGTMYVAGEGKGRRAAEPLGNRMAFPQSVEVFLVLFFVEYLFNRVV